MPRRRDSRAPAAGARPIPDREAFRIGEVATLAGVRPSVLRFWEAQFPALRPAKTRAGQRTYRRADVELVMRIRALLYDQGFTIAGARQALVAGDAPAAGSAAAATSDEAARATPDRERRRAVVAAMRNEIDALLRLVDG